MRIIALRRGIGGAVALTTGLNPDESVDELIARLGGWTHTESGVLHVAPVAPLALAGGLVSVAACVICFVSGFESMWKINAKDKCKTYPYQR